MSRHAEEARPGRSLEAGSQTNADLAAALELAAKLIRDGRPGALELVAGLVPALEVRPSGALVDARTVALAVGLSAEWVRDHAPELGGIRVGTGPRGRWRFDLEEARRRLAARSTSERPEDPAKPAAPRRTGRKRPALMGTGVERLPIRGERPCP